MRLYRFSISGKQALDEDGVVMAPQAMQAPTELVNRLQKNLKHLRRWAKREDVSCFRLYDADLPEFASAIDVYETIDGEVYVHLQEYAAPKSIAESKTQL